MLRKVVVTSTFITALAAAANAQSSVQHPLKLTGIEDKVELVGTGRLPAPSPLAALVQPHKTRLRAELEQNLVAARRGSIRNGSTSPLAALKTPNPASTTVVGPEPSFFGFPGQTSLDTAIATGFVSEPPDQGLAVADGFVFEAINSVLAVYDPNGSLIAGPVSQNEFFGVAPEFDEITSEYGPFIADPRAYFDHQLKRWFVSVTELDTDPVSGAPSGRSHLYFAVSTSEDPFSLFNIYVIDTTNDGSLGTPAHPGCPCFGDQPLIGADKYGFYISANEFSIPGFPFTFNGSNIYALSKERLALGELPTPILFSGLPLAEGVGYSVQPASSLSFETEYASGVEYFLSALDFFGPLDNRIAVWAMLDTGSLRNVHPCPILTQNIIASEVYGLAPPARQNPGRFPLGMSLGEPLEHLDSNNDIMQQVVFEDGKLWSGLTTVVGSCDRRTLRAGILYFVVTPSVSGDMLTAHMDKQGYLAAPGLDSVINPAIGATPEGRAAMVFTLVGPTRTPAFLFSDVFFPSMAFTTLSATVGTGDIQLGGAGAAPEDGFTGYPEYGGDGVARWGDYSAAVADTDGSIWMATEWIPHTPRTDLTNWGTFIGQLR
ncbi:MAG: hypothetical protein ACJ74Z_07395 [Bryobacteraceae bacterium]